MDRDTYESLLENQHRGTLPVIQSPDFGDLPLGGPGTGYIYVAPGAPKYKDGGVGSRDNPANIACALSHYMPPYIYPGDTVYLHPGVYQLPRENATARGLDSPTQAGAPTLAVSVRGSKERPIHIQPWPTLAGVPVIDSADSILDPGTESRDFYYGIDDTISEYVKWSGWIVLTNSSEQTTYTETGRRGGGLTANGSNNDYENLIAIRTGGWGLWRKQEAGRVRNCILIHLGWRKPSRNTGHSIYTQTDGLTSRDLDGMTIIGGYSYGVLANATEAASASLVQLTDAVIIDPGAGGIPDQKFIGEDRRDGWERLRATAFHVRQEGTSITMLVGMSNCITAFKAIGTGTHFSMDTHAANRVYVDGCTMFGGEEFLNFPSLVGTPDAWEPLIHADLQVANNRFYAMSTTGKPYGFRNGRVHLWTFGESPAEFFSHDVEGGSARKLTRPYNADVHHNSYWHFTESIQRNPGLARINGNVHFCKDLVNTYRVDLFNPHNNIPAGDPPREPLLNNFVLIEESSLASNEDPTIDPDPTRKHQTIHTTKIHPNVVRVTVCTPLPYVDGHGSVTVSLPLREITSQWDLDALRGAALYLYMADNPMSPPMDFMFPQSLAAAIDNDFKAPHGISPSGEEEEWEVAVSVDADAATQPRWNPLTENDYYTRNPYVLSFLVVAVSGDFTSMDTYIYDQDDKLVVAPSALFPAVANNGWFSPHGRVGTIPPKKPTEPDPKPPTTFDLLPGGYDVTPLPSGGVRITRQEPVTGEPSNTLDTGE